MSRGLLREGARDPVSAYRIISAEKASGVPVSLACELLEVSRSGYYEWSTRAPSDRELGDAWLTEKIRQIHAENRGVYGAPRIHAELRIAHGIHVGRKRVERLMAAAGISGLVIRKRGRTTVRSVFASPMTWSSVSSDPSSPTCCGSPTSATCGPGRGGCTSRPCRTRSRGGSSAGDADHMREELVIDALTMALGAAGRLRG